MLKISILQFFRIKLFNKVSKVKIKKIDSTSRLSEMAQRTPIFCRCNGVSSDFITIQTIEKIHIPNIHIKFDNNRSGSFEDCLSNQNRHK